MVFASPRMICEAMRRAKRRGWKNPYDRSVPGTDGSRVAATVSPIADAVAARGCCLPLPPQHAGSWQNSPLHCLP